MKGWRVQSTDDGDFDEIVVGTWLHIERMSDKEIWYRIGDRTGHVIVNERGDLVKMTCEPGDTA